MKIYTETDLEGNEFIEDNAIWRMNIKDVLNDIKVTVAKIIYIQNIEYSEIDFDNLEIYDETTEEGKKLSINKWLYKYKKLESYWKMIEFAVEECYGKLHCLSYSGYITDSPQYMCILPKDIDTKKLKNNSLSLYDYLCKNIDFDEIEKDIKTMPMGDLMDKYTYSYSNGYHYNMFTFMK